MKIDTKLKKILARAEEKCVKNTYAIMTPEMILYTLTCYPGFKSAYTQLGGDVDALKSDLKAYIDKYVPKHASNATTDSYNVETSTTVKEIFEDAGEAAAIIGNEEVTLAHFLTLFVELCDSFGLYYMLKHCKEQNTDIIIKTICKEMKVEPIPSLAEICDISDQQDQENQANVMSQMMPPMGILMLANGQMSDGERGSSRDWKSMVQCLNDEVKKPDYVPLIGREKEINETIVALLRKEKNNPVHIGDAGTGKTAITMGIAKRINDGNIVDELKGYKIYSCNINSLLAGSIYRGEFEGKIKNIFEGASKEKAILYIDELHTICSNGSSDASNILKPYLIDNSIKIIGATTTKEYGQTIERDSALERRFQPINIEEPSKEETKNILNGIRGKYESYHKCVYPDNVIDAIINLADKHMNDRRFPDKAIDIMDEAGAYMQANGMKESVTMEIIEEIVANKCKIPRESVSSDEASLIEDLDSNMKKTVIGQDAAVDKIRQQIIVSRSGLRDKKKPVANLLFVGPTGVGKTFIAQTLADQLGIPLIKKDMSEYTEPHSVSKLFGSPAGYVGYDEGGMLVNEIRKTPNCVLLIDEIEKAHPAVYNVFLQIMDDARLSDSFGKAADFRNVILIMTSNAGAADVKFGLGFQNGGTKLDTTAIDKAVKTTFSPEFINRLDMVIKFNPMSEDMAKKIAVNQLKELSDMLSEKKVTMTYTDEVVNHIVKTGYSEQYGARNIKRIIEKDIKTKLGSEILFGSLKNGGPCTLSFKEDEFVIN